MTYNVFSGTLNPTHTHTHLIGCNFGCVIATGTIFYCRGGFSGSRYMMKTADFEVLRDVAMVTSFGSKIAITGFV